MGTVTMRYYVAEGDQADRVKEDGLELFNAQRRKRREFLERLGAIAFYEYRGRAPTAIAFDGEVTPTKREGFLPPTGEYENDRYFWVLKPDLRTKVGKALKAEMQSLEEFDFSGYVTRAFGLRNSQTIGYVLGKMALYTSVAGLIGGKLVFKIPFGGDSSGDHNNPVPLNVSVPEGFREILHSEYVALSEKDKEE